MLECDVDLLAKTFNKGKKILEDGISKHRQYLDKEMDPIFKNQTTSR